MSQRCISLISVSRISLRVLYMCVLYIRIHVLNPNVPYIRVPHIRVLHVRVPYIPGFLPIYFYLPYLWFWLIWWNWMGSWKLQALNIWTISLLKPFYPKLALIRFLNSRRHIAVLFTNEINLKNNQWTSTRITTQIYLVQKMAAKYRENHLFPRSENFQKFYEPMDVHKVPCQSYFSSIGAKKCTRKQRISQKPCAIFRAMVDLNIA